MAKSFEEKFQDAMDRKNSEDFDSAYIMLSELAYEYPNRPSVLGVLADVAERKGLIQEAADYFRQVTILSPKSEMASLGLFHTIFDLGDVNGAFEEMKRFISLKHSDEYTRLLDNITAALKDEEIDLSSVHSDE
jgi:predicted Zn-dependent protease